VCAVFQWYGQFRSRDKDGGRTIKSATVENPALECLDANIAVLCSLQPELFKIEVLDAVQGHSRSPMSVPMKSPYDFLSVNNTNVHRISHRFRDIAVYWLHIRLRQGCLYLTHSFRANPTNIVMCCILSKSGILWLHLCCRQSGSSYSQFDVVDSETYRFRRKTAEERS